MPGASVDGLVFRPAAADDAPGLALIYLRARQAAIPGLPEPWTPQEIADWLRNRLLVRATVLVACRGPALLAYAGWEADGSPPAAMLLHLYVDPAHRRQGLGTALLDRARLAMPTGFGLYCFERNADARAFYRRHDLVETGRRGGESNEENEPDIRLDWMPGTATKTGKRMP